jgi:preprotein translocase subunit SecD
VNINLDGKGGQKMSDETKDKVGQQMAVVFIENTVETAEENGQKVKKKKVVEEVINTATIQERLGRRFQIHGLSSTQEARDLALLLRAGALAAPIEIVEERTIGPSLGADNIRTGMQSVVIGFVAIMIGVALYYNLFGLVSCLALMMNLVLTVALMSMIQATLTMPGIAGMLLSVAMAVDANVLINERIREEIKNGNSPQASIHAGYDRAFATIADSNITTVVAALLLFAMGAGPVKGFAVTLCLGIATSMFTAITGTRAVVNLIYGGRKVNKLSI